MKTLFLFLIGFTTIIVMAEPDLDDPKTLKKITKEALSFERIQIRDKEGEKLAYPESSPYPYTGWVVQKKKPRFLFYSKEGRQHGPVIQWYKNDQKRSEVYYKEGLIHGDFIIWYENGQKSVEANYKDGKKDGHEISWDEKGAKKYACIYIDGKLNGLATKWDEEGQKITETLYQDGKEHGIKTRWWWPGGSKTEMHYEHGELRKLVDWHTNGKKRLVKHYKGNGTLHGLWAEWDEQGNKTFEAIYTDGSPPKHIRDAEVESWSEMLGL